MAVDVNKYKLPVMPTGHIINTGYCGFMCRTMYSQIKTLYIMFEVLLLKQKPVL